jgi:hypothetical protein
LGSLLPLILAFAEKKGRLAVMLGVLKFNGQLKNSKNTIYLNLKLIKSKN